ncbi:MAG: hypothetical protein FE78DRAFT_177392 [Acidomyces sp. 'richmondensis']|nr:MAG: hypothetical protein FE78DRAFT_177392 [Acidomyces sp. 'richmondensis']
MEHKKSPLTPEQYARAIISLSRRYSSTSVFPGNNYLDIGEWMLQERSLLGSAKAHGEATLFASKSEQPHDLVVVYNSGDRKWDIQQYNQGEHEAFSAAASAAEDGAGELVFIRGFVSPLWISAIGSKYQIDPEFFRRHMDFLSVSIDRHAFSSPSLASTSNNIFRLCVSTLLHRDQFGDQNLNAQRKDQSSQLATYKIQQLGSTRVSCGDSLVRNYSTLDSSFSVLEQWISICITKQERGWAVIAWMDQGRPLEKSPPGPWTNHIKSKATALPILQSHPKMAFRTTTNRLDAKSNASAELQQSGAILPLQYDSLLALVDLARRAPQDPLSMCIPLFAHAAFSELHFLNLMESRIEIQINAISERVPDDAVETFQFFSSILNRHVQHIKDTLRALCRLAERNIQGSNGGRGKRESHSSMSRSLIPPILGGSARRTPSDTEAAKITGCNGYDGTFTVKGLMEDYEELHVRCLDLSEMCTRGITLAMTKATIDESRKGIEQSERVKKLTLLATFFIPLSFVTGLFGMNLDILDQSPVSFWWFFVLCVPINLLAYVIYVWDWPALRRFWARLRKRSHASTSVVPVERGEKDVRHIV